MSVSFCLSFFSQTTGNGHFSQTTGNGHFSQPKTTITVGKFRIAVGKFRIAVGKFRIAVGKFKRFVSKYNYQKCNIINSRNSEVWSSIQIFWWYWSSSSVGRGSHIHQVLQIQSCFCPRLPLGSARIVWKHLILKSKRHLSALLIWVLVHGSLQVKVISCCTDPWFIRKKCACTKH